MKKTVMFLAVVPLLALPAAYASTITLGQTINGAGDNFTNINSSNLVATTNFLSATGENGNLHVLYNESVYSGNSFCSTCLNFVISVTNTALPGGDPMDTLSTSSFAGFQTDIGTWGTGGVAPSSFYRSGDGSILNVYFNGSGDINPQQTSEAIAIETDATNYVPGTLSFIDHDVADAVGFAPASAVPEPMSLGLLGGGLSLLGFAGIRRRAKK